MWRLAASSNRKISGRFPGQVHCPGNRPLCCPKERAPAWTKKRRFAAPTVFLWTAAELSALFSEPHFALSASVYTKSDGRDAARAGPGATRTGPGRLHRSGAGTVDRGARPPDGRRPRLRPGALRNAPRLGRQRLPGRRRAGFAQPVSGNGADGAFGPAWKPAADQLPGAAGNDPALSGRLNLPVGEPRLSNQHRKPRGGERFTHFARRF